ncbi:MAG: hypothetical protein WBB01_23900 [Phormidesmis sp.]
MNAKVLNHFPLIAVCLAAISIPACITLRDGNPSAEEACRETDKAREYAVSQDIRLLYRPLAAVIDNQADTVIVAGRSRLIGLFSLVDAKQLPALSTDFSEFHSLALNEEKGYLVGGTADGATVVWNKSSDLETGWGATSVTLPGKHRGRVSAVAISANGELIGASSNDTIFIWQKEAGSDSWILKNQMYSAHSGLEVRDIAFGGASNILFSAGNDRRVKVWEAADSDSDSALFSYIAGEAIDSLTVNSEQAAFVGLRNGSVEVWEADAQQASESATPLAGESHAEPVKSLAVSTPDGLLVSGSNDKTVKVWDICTGEVFQTFLGHEDWVNSVDISSEGNTIVSTGIDDRVIIRLRQSE